MTQLFSPGLPGLEERQDWGTLKIIPYRQYLFDLLLISSDRDSTAPPAICSNSDLPLPSEAFPFFPPLEPSLCHYKKHMGEQSTPSSLLQQFTYMMVALLFPICLLWTEQNILLSVPLCTSCFLFSRSYCSLPDVHQPEKVSWIPLKALLLFNRV